MELVILNQMIQIAKIDGVRAAVAALITIFFLLLIDFRNLKLSLLTLLPLALSMASLLGIMAVAGIKFDFINIIAIPLLIGIGIDDGVHFTNTYCKSDHINMSEGMFQTGRAVVLTSLTTLVGFGSIALSHYPGLRSMGWFESFEGAERLRFPAKRWD